MCFYIYIILLLLFVNILNKLLCWYSARCSSPAQLQTKTHAVRDLTLFFKAKRKYITYICLKFLYIFFFMYLSRKERKEKNLHKKYVFITVNVGIFMTQCSLENRL